MRKDFLFFEGVENGKIIKIIYRSATLSEWPIIGYNDHDVTYQLYLRKISNNHLKLIGYVIKGYQNYQEITGYIESEDINEWKIIEPIRNKDIVRRYKIEDIYWIAYNSQNRWYLTIEEKINNKYREVYSKIENSFEIIEESGDPKYIDLLRIVRILIKEDIQIIF